jgi:hypothetical protein
MTTSMWGIACEIVADDPIVIMCSQSDHDDDDDDDDDDDLDNSIH